MAIAAIYDDFAEGAGYNGLVHAIYGSVGGLSVTGSQLWTQDVPGVQENAEFNDFFGYTLE